MMKINFAVVVPMANEEVDFFPFITAIRAALDSIGSGTVYLVVDTVSRDATLKLCQELSGSDARFQTVWAPENRNVVDAYLRGYREAYRHHHDYIIEMDAGLSHDPAVLPQFIQALTNGYDCVFGSRFIKGGSIYNSTWKRTFLSKFGTKLSNALLGTTLKDMTSGYQGFKAVIVGKFLEYPFLSKAHFYQTEMRYLLRKTKYIEIPIQYRAPSPSVSGKSIRNSTAVLLYYFFQRLKNKAASIS